MTLRLELRFLIFCVISVFAFLSSYQAHAKVTRYQQTVLPVGSFVVLQGSNGAFITVNDATNLAVNENSISNAKVFQVIDAGNGKVALWERVSNKYVTHDDSDYGRVKATATSIGNKEKFTVESLPSGGFSIKASNGMFVKAAYSSAGVLLANSTSPEKFMMQVQSALPIGSSVVLQGSNTRFITILDGGINALSVNENSISNAEVFQVIDAGNGKVALLASNNKYVTHDDSVYGRVGATATSIGNKEKFTVEGLPSGGFSIKASNGMFVQAAYSSGGVLLANSTSPEKFMMQVQ